MYQVNHGGSTTWKATPLSVATHATELKKPHGTVPMGDGSGNLMGPGKLGRDVVDDLYANIEIHRVLSLTC